MYFKGDQLYQLEQHTEMGQWLRLQFNQVKINIKLPKHSFQLDIPKNTTRIIETGLEKQKRND